MKKDILLVGESWTSYTTHIKGFDSFYTSTYETGEIFLKNALEKNGYNVTFLNNHEAAEKFPFELEELQKYGCIILSDIGANTLLLPHATFTKSERRPNRCNLIKDYVLGGGSLLMVGGYMTFSGIDGKGKWQDTKVQDVLPVYVSPYDDRMEHCEGVYPKTVLEHEVVSKIKSDWIYVLGYNKTKLKEDATLIAEIEGDPFIAIGEYGKGRSAVFTTDCAPHWAPPEFVNWEDYDNIWAGLLQWLIK